MAEHHRALLIDDDDDLRDTLTLVLTERGWVTEAYGEGSAALERLRAATEPAPDLLLLDLMMPSMDGWQFLEEKGGDARLAGIPVVLMSASRLPADSHEHVAAILQKPFSIEALLTTVERAVQWRDKAPRAPLASPTADSKVSVGDYERRGTGDASAADGRDGPLGRPSRRASAHPRVRG
jgi:CheY-like chemotaxis protein